MKMKTLAVLSLGLAVALALPALPPGEELSPVLTKENQRPLLGDVVPVQGHVVVENPAPQVISPPTEEQEKVTEAAMKQNMLELEVKVKTDGEQEVKAEPEVEVEQAGMVEIEVKVKPEVKVEEMFEAQQEVKAEPGVPVEVKAKMVNAKAGVNPQVEGDQELKDDSEVKVELDQQMEPEPEERHMLHEEKFQEHMHLVADPGLEEEDDDDDMEENNEMEDEPVMELEPLDDNTLLEPLSEEEEEFMRKRDYVLGEEPVMEMMGQPLVQLYEEPETGDQVMLDEGDPTGLVSDRENQATRQRRHSFHLCLQLCQNEPRKLFCQEKFPGGHLASITSQYIHSELLKMILKKNGKYTRTWVGGLRFLETGRFIWLDGSKWEYADWLSGEPNNTANRENCLEVLAYENGKFNGFTCWEPQAFICSYYY